MINEFQTIFLHASCSGSGCVKRLKDFIVDDGARFLMLHDDTKYNQ